MRFVIDVPPLVARRLIEAMESGRFGSVDEVASRALIHFLEHPEGTADAISEGMLDTTPGPTALEAVSFKRWIRKPGGERTITGDPTFDTSERPNWIWGMVNRVFPLKLVARVCSNICSTGPATLHSLHQRSAECAFEIGKALSEYDRLHARRRNESRAVSLPSGDEPTKSMVRFAHQFVGRRGTERPFIGGAFDIGLLGVSSAGLIAPTTAGWTFAELSNPVLDADSSADWNLSAEECHYYLNSIAGAVPAERAAFSAILGALSREPLNPEQLARVVMPTTPANTSTVVADTARSGALGRLIDVRAIVREPKGRSAVFTITNSGRETQAALLEST